MIVCNSIHPRLYKFQPVSFVYHLGQAALSTTGTLTFDPCKNVYPGRKVGWLLNRLSRSVPANGPDQSPTDCGSWQMTYLLQMGWWKRLSASLRRQ